MTAAEEMTAILIVGTGTEIALLVVSFEPDPHG